MIAQFLNCGAFTELFNLSRLTSGESTTSFASNKDHANTVLKRIDFKIKFCPQHAVTPQETATKKFSIRNSKLKSMLTNFFRKLRELESEDLTALQIYSR